MHIRKMELEDSEAIYALSQACFSEPWSLESIQKEMQNPVAHYLVAIVENQVIGYGGLWHVLDEGEIINIAVSHELRRRGIGEALLKALIEEAKQYQLVCIHLEVRESNASAQALYKKFGFSMIARRKGYYHKPLEDAIIMEWRA